MHRVIHQISSKLKRFLTEELGQDMVEYALVVALIAFGATAGMRNVAGGVNKAYDNISTNLNTYVT
jgi:pilus assembly protein Flp/PilA